ncbi:unnamed protein product [Owenia fusiformis]|uniref:Uncharacterized protein n=1 Tax=Owenia fusiformis TaxID=6347 RepID=A0A8J1XPB4_OWEFU|nr:unnamed protein product [Owenia fusiformis]
MGCGGSKTTDNSDNTGPRSPKKSNSPSPKKNNPNDEHLHGKTETCEASEHESSKDAEEVKYEDEPVERMKTEEEPPNKLPLGDYGDGRLGVATEDVMIEKLKVLSDDELYCDADFPADNEALYYSEGRVDPDIEWKRPKDILEDGKEPRLLVDGVSKEDIKQGELGDCWFLSSCAAVSQQERFMKMIFPCNQPLSGPGYKGAVKFKFWRFGEWIDVLIDDLLPTKNNQLVYARCSDETEFWVALLEKAYAKLHGSYEAIEGGQSMDALVDLTGGLGEIYDIYNNPDNKLYQKFRRAQKAGSFIACSKKGDWRSSDHADKNGLVSGHAYTITGVARIKQEGAGFEKLIRVRNPWGDSTEWNGPWSDGHSNWDNVDDSVKKAVGFTEKGDGEFWMSFDDFCAQFNQVTICTTGPDFDGDGDADQGGCIMYEHGEWKEDTAGGCRNDLDSFATNPQFDLHITDVDDDDDEDEDETKGKACVVIALMQEHRRSKRHMGVKELQIGFVLYKCEDGSQKLPKKHFMYNYDAGKSGTYINLREVSARFDLEPGHYMVIPSTFNKGDTGKFMMRVFAEKKIGFKGPVTE